MTASAQTATGDAPQFESLPLVLRAHEDFGQEPRLGEGDAFDFAIPFEWGLYGAGSVVRFRYRSRFIEDGRVHLLVVSGMPMMRRLQVLPGCKIRIKPKCSTCDPIVVAMSNPSVQVLGVFEDVLVKHSTEHGWNRVTKAGEKAGYGPAYDPFAGFR